MGLVLQKAAFALAAYGPWGIFVLAAVDSLGVPLPAAIDLLVVGIAASSAHAAARAYGAAVLAIAGSLGGNIALFQTVRHGRRLFGKPATAPASRTSFEAWFHRYGLLTVFVPAVTPVPPLPLKVFVISAGVLRTRFRRFVAAILGARTIRYLGLAWLGIQLGGNAPVFLRHNGWMLAGVALLPALMVVCLNRWKKGRPQRVYETQSQRSVS
jgi:membrane protein DedA with SNARE-associated domain